MISQDYIPFMSLYTEKGKTAALSAGTGTRLAFQNLRAGNRSGASINVGLLRSLPVSLYKLYTLIATVYADVTSSISGGVVIVTATNNEGYAVGAKKRFGLVGVTVSNTATGGTYEFTYWNGSSFTALTTLETFTNFNATGDKYIAFIPPLDWAKGGGGALDSDMYHIRVRHTTAPGDTGAINALWIGQFLDFYEGVADNAVVQLDIDSLRPLILDASEDFFPYFSTAHADNYVGAMYATVK